MCVLAFKRLGASVVAARSVSCLLLFGWFGLLLLLLLLQVTHVDDGAS